MNFIKAIIGGAIMGACYAKNINLKRKVEQYNMRISENQKKLDRTEGSLKQLVAHNTEKETE